MTPKKVAKKSHETIPMISNATLTPPNTPAKPEPVQLSSSAILITDSHNQLSINRFKGITPVITALNNNPLRLTFPRTEDSETFVVTGVLKEHDMAIMQEVLFPLFLN